MTRRIGARAGGLLAAVLVATVLTGIGPGGGLGQLFWSGGTPSYPAGPQLGDGPGYAPPTAGGDTGPREFCGDGVCEYATQEWNRCDADCGPACFWTGTCGSSSAPAAHCGDGVCQSRGNCLGLGCPAEPEDECSCPADCPPSPATEALCACRAFDDREPACESIGPGRCDEAGTSCCTDACRLTACSNGRDDDEDAEFWGLFGASGIDGEDYGCLEPHPDEPLTLVYRPERDDERDRYNDLDVPEAGLELLDGEAQVAALPAAPPPRRGPVLAFMARLLGHHLDHDPQPQTPEQRSRWTQGWRDTARRIAAEGHIPVTMFYTVYEQGNHNSANNFVSRDGTRTERMWNIYLPMWAKPLPPPPIQSRPNVRTGAYDAVVLECRAKCLDALPTIDPEFLGKHLQKANVRTTSGIRFREVRLEWCVTDCICGSREAALDDIQRELEDAERAAFEGVAAAGLATDAEVAAARQQITQAADAHHEELARAREAVEGSDECYQDCMTTGLPDRHVCGTHDPDCCRAACVGGICIPPRAPDTSAYQAAAAAVHGAGDGGGGGAEGGNDAPAEPAAAATATSDASAASSTEGGDDAEGGPGGGGTDSERPPSSAASTARPSSPTSTPASATSRFAASSPSRHSSTSPRPSSRGSAAPSFMSSSRIGPSAVSVVSSARLLSSLGLSSTSSASPPTVTFLPSRASAASGVSAAAPFVPRYYLATPEPASPPWQPTAVLVARVACGDGLRQAGEECDDGNARDFDGCTADCLWERGRCGDGIVQSLRDEQCEPALAGVDVCSDRCRFRSRTCGDGRIDPGEACDAGPANAETPNAACRSDCGPVRCGDGILDDRTEACDDGNRVGQDGCDPDCRPEPGAGPALGARVFEFPRPRVPSSSPVTAPSNPPNQATVIRVPATAATGPAALAAMAAGAAAGAAWVRRRRP